MKTILTFYFFAFLSSGVFAQGYSVTGNVADSANKKFLEGAYVALTHQTDAKVIGIVTDKQGKFGFKSLPGGKYTINITFVGYSVYKKDIDLRKNISLNTIYLSSVGIRMKEVEITDKTPVVELKTDTTEYNAGAFKTNKNANAEDLLTKMPGITVQNGTVQAQGENVTKVLVDGREYFGSDPNAVIKNLPAEIIEKIQVFDQKSDQAQFTGFDDGNTNKTINVVTRLNNKQGTFGKFTGGYGNDDRYATGGNINFFNQDQRITVLAQLNNINQQNFSSEDLLGVISVSGRGFNRRGGGGGPGGQRGPGGGPGNFTGPGGGGGFGGGFGGGNISNFLVNQTTGLVSTKAFGVNYSDKWGEKIDLTASYFFNLTNNDAESATNRNYFLSTSADQLYNETSSSITKNLNHRFNLRLNYQADQANSILFNPTFIFQQNNASSSVAGITSSGLQNLNSTASMFNTNLSAINSTNNLLLRHRFETPGRTLSVGFAGTFTKNYGSNNLYAQDKYYDSTVTSDTLNQNAGINKNGFNGSSNIVYTEPISKNGMLQFNGRLSYSEDRSDQKTYDNSLNTATQLDTSLSNVYKEIYKTQSIGTGYTLRANNLMLMFGVNYNIAELNNGQSFPRTGSIEKNFYSVLPSFMMRYVFSQERNMMIFYRTMNDNPTIDQLQDVVNNSNPTQLSTGNPNLSQDYKHSIVIRYLESSGEHMRTFFALLGATVTQNYIGNNTILANKDTVVMNNILLNPGTRLSVPENLNGYVNLRSFVTYGLPVSLIKSNLNLNLSANYTRTPGVINNISGISNSSSYGIGAVIGSNISDKVDFTLSSTSNFNYVSNSAISGSTTNGNGNYFTQNTTLRFFWQFWEGFVLQNDLNDQFNNSLPSTDRRRNVLLWNISIGKKFLGSDNGEIRFTANDILNQNTSVQRNVTDSYYEDVQTNVLGRYFLLSFIYNIRAF